jgi:hypothetical protein
MLMLRGRIYGKRRRRAATTTTPPESGEILLENGTDSFLLEDSSGVLLLEG